MSRAMQQLVARLARWAGRWSPLVEVDGPDGLRLDVTGVAHLFGGEAGLVRDIEARFAAIGLSVRVAVAESAGAAWGLARFGRAACDGRGAGRPAGALAGRRLAPAAGADADAGAVGIEDHRPIGRGAAAEPRAALSRGRQSGRCARPDARAAARAAHRGAVRNAAAIDASAGRAGRGSGGGGAGAWNCWCRDWCANWRRGGLARGGWR